MRRPSERAKLIPTEVEGSARQRVDGGRRTADARDACRGEADDESDVDILIVLSEMRAYGKEVAESSELVAGLSLEYGVAVTPVFVPGAEWREGRGFFVASVREEAIAA